jgi:hypothetical protein
LSYISGFNTYERNTGQRHPLSLGTKYFKCEDAHDPLTHRSMLWMGTLYVGTPPVEYTVDLDTGSSDIFLPGETCDRTCEGHTHPLQVLPPALGKHSLLNMVTGPPSPDNNSLTLSLLPISRPPTRLSALLIDTAQASILQNYWQTVLWEWVSRVSADTMPFRSSRASSLRV